MLYGIDSLFIREIIKPLTRNIEPIITNIKPPKFRKFGMVLKINFN